MLNFARLVGASPVPVLLLGETGCGKTHLASVIHALSRRSRQPFLRINCGAIPDALFEREMFGHVRGAYTDAREGGTGFLEAADGGTLFLDEIGELPLQVQAKLLTVLEDGNFRRLGSTRQTRVDVRIIAATSAPLATMVREKRFRADLYHRLAVVRYEILPLRKRREEHDQLIRIRLPRCTDAPADCTIPLEIMERLRDYPWPGNIRELENALRHVALFSRGEPVELRHFPEEIRTWVATSGEEGGESGRRYIAPDDREAEQRMILAALRAARGNKTHAARELGMSRSTLWAKLQRFGGDIEGALREPERPGTWSISAIRDARATISPARASLES